MKQQKIRLTFRYRVSIKTIWEAKTNAGMDFHPDNFRYGWNQVLGKAVRDFVEKDQVSALTATSPAWLAHLSFLSLAPTLVFAGSFRLTFY